jgi:2-succinyl-6-hydroxy-2,4-cyclohexadiene-1-carboxylate synthase
MGGHGGGGTAGARGGGAVRRLWIGPAGERLCVTLPLEPDGEGVPERSGPPWLLALHGFTGSWRTWRTLARQVRGRLRVAVAEAPGHGDSDAPPDPAAYDLWRGADRLAEAIGRISPDRPVHVLGYSMGGRQALHLALAHPEDVCSLVLEGASPGIEDEAERRARQEADEALAVQIERQGVAAFVGRWQALPLFAGQAAMAERRRAALRRERLGQRAEGLAASLRGAGAGRQDNLWPRLGQLAVPVLFVAGARDERYAAIGRRLVAAMPRARLALVAGAGHSAHLERPLSFRRAVEAFWDEIGATAPP